MRFATFVNLPFALLSLRLNTFGLHCTRVMSFCLVLCAITQAQAVPVPSGVTLWLNANDSASITKNGLNQVAGWNDLSGSGNHATQTINDNLKPVWNGGGTLNGRSTINFDGLTNGTGDYMSLGANNLFNMSGTAGFSFFSIVRFTGTATNTYPGILTARAGQTQQVQFFRSGNTQYNPFSFGSSESSRLRPNSTADFSLNWQMYDAFYNGAEKNTNSNYSMSADGKSQTLAATAAGFAVDTPPTSFLGSSANATVVRDDQRWLGDMAEIIVYNRILSTAEQFITENYLSSKYDLDISAGGRDRYFGDTPGNSNFDADVFGVGRRDDGLTPGSVTTGTSRAVTMSITAGLDNDDFLLGGFQNEGELDAKVIYLDGTNLEGDEAITLTFDISQLDLPNGPNTYQLLYDATNPLGLSLLPNTANTVGNLVSFQLNGNLLDGFYSLQITPAPEPNSMLLMLGVLGCGVLRRRKRLAALQQA